jgi:hypothetical protein
MRAEVTCDHGFVEPVGLSQDLIDDERLQGVPELGEDCRLSAGKPPCRETEEMAGQAGRRCRRKTASRRAR